MLQPCCDGQFGEDFIRSCFEDSSRNARLHDSWGTIPSREEDQQDDMSFTYCIGINISFYSRRHVSNEALSLCIQVHEAGSTIVLKSLAMAFVALVDLVSRTLKKCLSQLET